MAIYSEDAAYEIGGVSLRAVKGTNQAMMKRRPVEAGCAKENSLD